MRSSKKTSELHHLLTFTIVIVTSFLTGIVLGMALGSTVKIMYTRDVEVGPAKKEAGRSLGSSLDDLQTQIVRTFRDAVETSKLSGYLQQSTITRFGFEYSFVLQSGRMTAVAAPLFVNIKDLAIKGGPFAVLGIQRSTKIRSGLYIVEFNPTTANFSFVGEDGYEAFTQKAVFGNSTAESGFHFVNIELSTDVSANGITLTVPDLVSGTIPFPEL